MIEAFLTGSHAYGRPREDSDIDICVLADHITRTTLRALCDDETSYPTKPGYDARDGESLRFGRINLIVVPNKAEFEAWRQATEELTVRKPVTRDEAKARIIELVEETR